MRQLFTLVLVCIAAYVFAGARDTLLTNELTLYRKGEYKEVIPLLQARIKQATDKKDNVTIVSAYRILGNAYSSLPNTVEALKAYQASITAAEAINDKKGIARSIANIGSLFSDNKDFDKALKKFDEAEAISATLNDTTNLADCANNKGVIYEQLRQYDEALKQYQKALTLYQQLKNEGRIAILYNNLGIVYKYLENYDRSLEYYGKSLKMAEQLQDNFLMAANIVNMGNVYQMKHDYGKAIEMNERGLKLAKAMNANELAYDVEHNLAEAYAKSGNYRAAYAHYEQYDAIKDTFINVERSHQLADMQTKYETDKKVKEIALLKQEKEITDLNLSKKELQLRTSNFEILGIIAVGLLLGSVAFSVYKWKMLQQKQEQEKAVLDAEYKERLRIARDVHDDLGSGLSKISLMASLAQQRAGGNTELGSDIVKISSVSRELVDNMRDLIWVLNPEHTTLDQLVVRLREYCADYLDGVEVDALLDFPEHVANTAISREMQRNVFFTVKEALNNCIKHAQATLVTVKLRAGDDLDISVSDNGNGLHLSPDDSKGNGLRNMRQRILAIGGSFEISSPERGTTIHIIIPVKKSLNTTKV